jgi:ABC-type amino acid transport substrate-binding protein
MRGLNKDYSQAVDVQLSKLLNGRTDVIVGSRLVLDYLSQREGLGDRLKELLIIGRRPLYIVFGRHGGSRLRSLSERLSQVLSEMREDGSLSAISENCSNGK